MYENTLVSKINFSIFADGLKTGKKFNKSYQNTKILTKNLK